MNRGVLRLVLLVLLCWTSVLGFAALYQQLPSPLKDLTVKPLRSYSLTFKVSRLKPGPSIDVVFATRSGRIVGDGTLTDLSTMVSLRPYGGDEVVAWARERTGSSPTGTGEKPFYYIKVFYTEPVNDGNEPILGISQPNAFDAAPTAMTRRESYVASRIAIQMDRKRRIRVLVKWAGTLPSNAQAVVQQAGSNDSSASSTAQIDNYDPNAVVTMPDYVKGDVIKPLKDHTPDGHIKKKDSVEFVFREAVNRDQMLFVIYVRVPDGTTGQWKNWNNRLMYVSFEKQ